MTISLTGSSGANSTSALAVVDAALAQITATRGALGAYQNRFSSAIANLQTTSENLSASRSRIQDADFAAETANLTRARILQQAGTAMLAQANAIPDNVLTLFRDFNNGTHGHAGRFTITQLNALRIRVESAIRFIHALCVT